jgi:DNA-directed RNA polymerase specialized sigma24 family protein
MDNLVSEIQKNNRLLQAVIGLLALDYEKSGRDERIELVLAASGLGYQEIATALGKKPDAVRMLLKRNK